MPAGGRARCSSDSLGEDALDLSLGRQDFHVGDGFLIWDGNFDTGGDGAYWLSPRSAFKMTGLARLKIDPVSGQLFYLEADGDQGDTQVVGANLDYQPGFGTIGATYLQVVDANASFEADTPREGMQAAALRLNEVHYPDFEDATLYAEYVQEFGDGDHVDFNAYAFYVEPAYTFSSLPWTPSITYRFAYFSGDSNPGNDKRKDFDPLFYEGDRSWGTWTQGEIVGNYLLFNSNQVNHMVRLAASPTDAVDIGAIYFHFDLAEKNYFGTQVSDRDFADEVDVYTDWTINDNLSVGRGLRRGVPGRCRQGGIRRQRPVPAVRGLCDPDLLSGGFERARLGSRAGARTSTDDGVDRSDRQRLEDQASPGHRRRLTCRRGRRPPRRFAL